MQTQQPFYYHSSTLSFSTFRTCMSTMSLHPHVCTSCVHNCRLFHRSTTTSPTSFYKFILHQNDFKLLYLPPKFNRTMSNLVGKKIELEDSSGERSVVTVAKVDGSFAFKEGWDDFSLKHGLEIGDLLVFNCINKLNFDVKIYDESVCERIDFSRKRKSKKRSRCRSGSPDRGGMLVRHKSIENVSENDNEDGMVQSMCRSEHIEDARYITPHMYQNDPMFEEVLATGDASYASKLELFGRNNFLGETDKRAYDMTSPLKILEENIEHRSIMSNREVQECQFSESSKGKHASHAFELEISERNTSLGDSDNSAYDKTSTLKLEENKDGKFIMSKKETQECQFSEGLGSALAAISEDRLSEISNLLEAQIYSELTEVIKGEFNQDHESHFETASISCVALTDDDRHNTKLKFNEISNLLHDQTHPGEMKEAPMDMTPKLCSFNDKLNTTGLQKVIKEEFIEDGTAETVTCEVLADDGYLKLPKSLPLPFWRYKMKRKVVVLLRDPLRRLWPVLYVEETWLTSGWLDFLRANNIKSGDVCDFRAEKDKSEHIFDVHIDHNHK